MTRKGLAGGKMSGDASAKVLAKTRTQFEKG